MAKCMHYRTPVVIDDKTIYVTGSQYLTQKGYVPMDHAVFLDAPTWTAALENPYAEDTVVFDWPDFQAVDLDNFKGLLLNVAQRVVSGNTVEIGCIGAHGRTGTLLAGLLIATEDFDAINAVEEIRERYCDKAVETKVQHELLNQLEASEFRLMLTVPKMSFLRRIGRFFRLVR